MALSRLIYCFLIIMLGGCSPKLPSFDNNPNLSLPENLDAYLTGAEAKVNDLKPGTEKEIRWHNKRKKQKTPYAIVYFHGFSATKREISPVVETVADAIGANVYFTRLTGHGITGVSTLAQATVDDWIRDSWEALEIGKRLGDKVILMGTSMGAVPAVQMAVRNREVTHIILFAPVLEEWSNPLARIASGPVGKPLLHLYYGKTRRFEPKNDQHRYFWTTEYEVEALQNLLKMAAIQNHTNLGLLTQRSLVFYSKKDPITTPDGVEKGFMKIGSGIRRLVHLDAATEHDLTGEIAAPATVPFVNKEILRFLRDQ